MHKIRQGNEYYNFEEMCPHCGTSHPVVVDDKDFIHYSIECPVCRNKFMLCTLCRWDQEVEDGFDGNYKCDWCEGKECFRNHNDSEGEEEQE